MQIKEFFINIEKRTKVFPYTLGILSIFSVLSYILLFIGYNSLDKKVEAAQISNAFENIEISAKSAIVLDISSSTAPKILYEKNADEPLPLASLTKIMTAATAFETASGMKDVSITEGNLEPEGSYGFFVGSKWKFQDLIDYTLLVSANDGASAIAATAGAFGSNITINSTSSENVARNQFVINMNALAETLGLTESKFFNEHGLDRDENHVGAFGSARDMAKLFQYVLEKYPGALEATKYPNLRFTDESGFVYNGNNTNISVNEIPSLIASKTGFTDLAGGNLIIAFDAGLNRPVIISVLGSTKEKRFEDVLLLASTTLSYFKN